MKIRPVGAKLFMWTDGRTDGWTDGQTNLTKLIVVFRNSSKAPTNVTARKKLSVTLTAGGA